ncbi:MULTISPECIES: patatin-like phospholipase family protein [Zunongwangia]|uniref:Patatin-like phospholipase n=1 Tax=Zunongwangia atlantica 22II14-10F7 TaxID=1185767 RepID=A0A1Y1T5L6_9FLAO|nr:patatin-like phospholipase family protein [Zunongwangia atlantica]ORL46339.1 patatin-like phospholipase [Zunongwangia atlantica 22II14-10F7]
MRKVRILSIDGGGIRGILPGTILTYIEEQLRNKTGNPDAKIGEYFDFIAGTSTGGILSLVYLCPDEQGNFKYGAKEALDIYLDQGDEIFDVSLGKKLRSLGGISDEKYDEKELEEALSDFLEERTLKDVLKPCLITSYDIRNRKAHFFTSADANSDIFNYKLKDVARATSAAPTYFEPAKIKSIYGTPHFLIDGGVFANNPALCAYAEARTMKFSKILNDEKLPDNPGAKDMLIVSIGTGTVKEAYTYKEFKDAGAIKWIKPLIDIMMSGNSETVDYQLKQIYETLAVADCEDYHRIQPKISLASSEMDKADIDNLKALYQDGLSAVRDYKEELDIIIDKLL